MLVVLSCMDIGAISQADHVHRGICIEVCIIIIIIIIIIPRPSESGAQLWK
jgi:hypothetical protein